MIVAIAALKEREPGTFLIRDSNSFQGAYGLALKVATPPPNVSNHNSKGKKKNYVYIIKGTFQAEMKVHHVLLMLM